MFHPQNPLSEFAAGLSTACLNEAAPKPDLYASAGAAQFPSPSRHWFFPSRCGILAQGH
jgi:hypothetical protein